MSSVRVTTCSRCLLIMSREGQFFLAHDIYILFFLNLYYDI